MGGPRLTEAAGPGLLQGCAGHPALWPQGPMITILSAGMTFVFR